MGIASFQKICIHNSELYQFILGGSGSNSNLIPMKHRSAKVCGKALKQTQMSYQPG